jgi:hypothetical protein
VTPPPDTSGPGRPADAHGAGTRPIGWWIKEADAALDGAFASALDGEGVGRREWQVLASLARHPTTPADLTASLASFDGPSTIATLLADLRARGLVAESDGRLHLTDAGSAMQARLAARVDGVRGRVAAALPGEDLPELVRLLGRLVAGLRPPS